jgi:NCS2 family nucleobase:cation symporter-2
MMHGNDTDACRRLNLRVVKRHTSDSPFYFSHSAAGRRCHMPKPTNLIYGVDETPDWGAMILLGIQHIFVLSIAFVFPVVVIDAIGGTPDQAQSMISMAMIATGIGTMLQGLNKGPVGSGYLCPLLNGPAFLSASVLAGKTGGLSLIFGMTAVGATLEALFSRIITKMRPLFPAEVTGTIVTMVGIEVIPVAVSRFLGIDRLHAEPDVRSLIVALTTLVAMVSFNVWGKGKLRLYSVLLGLLVGYGLSILAGILRYEHLREILDASFFTVPPFAKHGVSFDAALLAPFLVATLSSALKAMGDISICQKINDTEWKRPDIHSISRGILACAVGNLVSGLSGGLGQSVSSSNIGLSVATGATSRKIAFATGGILILLAFLPKLAMVYVIMPTPVMGACLVFSVSFMILAGIQIMMSRMIDSRKTFVIGISVIFGLAVDMIPGMGKSVHPWLQPFFVSSLSLATVCAFVLNLFFRIGIAKTLKFELTPGVDSSGKVFSIMQKQGGLWGAIKDVVDHATVVICEFLEAAAISKSVQGSIDVEVSFDELNLDVVISYTGEPIELLDVRPSSEELLLNDSGLVKFSGYLMRMHADKVKCSVKDRRCRAHFHFDH